MNIYLLTVVLCFCMTQNKVHSQFVSIQSTIDMIEGLVPTDYHKEIRPDFGGGPVNVTFDLHIASINEVSEKKQQFRAQFYFAQEWNDYRLAFRSKPGVREVRQGRSLMKKLWLPDTVFSNGKMVQTQKQTLREEDATICIVKSTGDVYVSAIYDVVFSCLMDLIFYPFDRQLCSIEVESTSITDYEFHWRENATKLENNLTKAQTPNFKSGGVRLYTRAVQLTTGKSYETLVAEIALDRNYTIFVFTIYLPAFLLVLTSWVPLHLTASENGSLRIVLSLLSLLLFTLFVNSQSSVVETNYLKVIDLYLLVAFWLVFSVFAVCSLVKMLPIHPPLARLIFGYYHEVEFANVTLTEREAAEKEQRLRKKVNSFYRRSRLFISYFWFVFNFIYVCCICRHVYLLE